MEDGIVNFKRWMKLKQFPVRKHPRLWNYFLQTEEEIRMFKF